MSGALDSKGKLTLLTGVQTGFARRLNPSVWINKPL
jgi:hypothetical protein